jgi:hypothetical protein
MWLKKLPIIKIMINAHEAVRLQFIEPILMIGNESARGTEFQAWWIKTKPCYHLTFTINWRMTIPQNFEMDIKKFSPNLPC